MNFGWTHQIGSIVQHYFSVFFNAFNKNKIKILQLRLHEVVISTQWQTYLNVK